MNAVYFVQKPLTPESSRLSMFKWLKNLLAAFQPPQPTGPAVLLHQFSPAEPTISGDASWSGEELKIASDQAATIRLFEYVLPSSEQCMLTYRVQASTQNLASSAYLELWCRVPGFGESFSRGLHQKVTGTNDFMTLEIPFYLRKGQAADLLKLNIVFEGAGEVRMKEIQVLSTPLAS